MGLSEIRKEIHNLLPVERQWRILNTLKHSRSITVAELGEELAIGEATIRRDLQKLEDQGLLKRSHGGAVAIDGINAEIPLPIREFDQREEKDSIGKLAAGLIKDGDTIVLDSSTTCFSMIRHLHSVKKLTVITNGAKTAVELGKQGNIYVYSTGGIMREDAFSFIGDKAKDFLKDYFFDKVFFSARAISLERGITFSSQFEAELRKVMIHNSRYTCLLVDHTRFDRTAFYFLSDFRRIDMIITDREPPPEWKAFLAERNISVLFPEHPPPRP